MTEFDDAASVGSFPTTDLQVSQDGKFALVPQFILRVEGGSQAGQVFSSSGEPTIIGTHHSAAVVLTERSVSRFHCEIGFRGGHHYLRDLDSRNGTGINGVRIDQAYPQHGCTLYLGDARLRFEVSSATSPLALSEASQFGDLVGTSTAMRALFAVLERAAASETTVLLEGETGTGKDLAAEAIHRASGRREGPFIIVDCATIPGELMESELFGHVAGAFTGATTSRIGAFEEAQRGTLFLDEVGELPFDLQAKLLRALESREVRRIGENIARPVDVRIIAATNRDLRRAVNTRRFRPDLYYRLAVVVARMPPLRERLGDLPLLSESILEAQDVTDATLRETLQSDAFIRRLQSYDWRGNVRELRNHLELCIALRERLEPGHSFRPGGTPEVDAVPVIDIDKALRVARREWISVFERRYLTQLLRAHGDNVSAAARAAKIARMQLHRMLKRNGLR
jgi:transcriptional regulator with PAS, ATPase and Fis domain